MTRSRHGAVPERAEQKDAAPRVSVLVARGGSPRLCCSAGCSSPTATTARSFARSAMASSPPPGCRWLPTSPPPSSALSWRWAPRALTRRPRGRDLLRRDRARHTGAGAALLRCLRRRAGAGPGMELALGLADRMGPPARPDDARLRHDRAGDLRAHRQLFRLPVGDLPRRHRVGPAGSGRGRPCARPLAHGDLPLRHLPAGLPHRAAAARQRLRRHDQGFGAGLLARRPGHHADRQGLFGLDLPLLPDLQRRRLPLPGDDRRPVAHGPRARARISSSTAGRARERGATVSRR